jgi:hypothetical protein
VKFINYVLGVNGAAWQREEAFLTCGQLKQEFGVYLQCQVSGAFVPATAAPQQHNNHNKQGGKCRGGGNSFRGGGFRGGRDGYRRGGFQYDGGRGSGGQGGYHHGGSGHQHGGGGGHPLWNSLPSGYWTASGYVSLCKNYNIGVCKNNPNNFKLPTGALALHLCGARKAGGEIWKEQHPAIDHK